MRKTVHDQDEEQIFAGDLISNDPQTLEVVRKSESLFWLQQSPVHLDEHAAGIHKSHLDSARKKLFRFHSRRAVYAHIAQSRHDFMRAVDISPSNQNVDVRRDSIGHSSVQEF